MNNDRLACVIFPNFSVEVCRKEKPELVGRAVAVVEISNDTAPILGVNRLAAAEGVTPEITVTQAQGRCPDLIIESRHVKREERDANKLFEILVSISPFVEQEEADLFYFDATGLTRLYNDDNGLVNTIMTRTQAMRYPIKIGIANNKFVARAAAETSKINSHTIVPPTRELCFLNPLPIDHLPVSNDTHEKLLYLGIKTLGQAASFPVNELSRRFGDEGTILSQLARGEDIDFFRPQFPVMKLSKRISFFDPVISRKMLIAEIEQILEETLADFSRHGKGCKTIGLTFLLDNYDQVRIKLALRQPVERTNKFIRQLTQKLSDLKLSSPVVDIILTLPEILPLVSSQIELNQIAPAGEMMLHDDEHIKATLGKLNLSVPVLNKAAIPELNFSLSPNMPTKNKQRAKNEIITLKNKQVYSSHPPAGLRLVQPSQKAAVKVVDGQLQTIRLRNHTSRVTKQDGPWSLSGQWWRGGFDRQYYEVLTDDNHLYLLYFDRHTSDWFLQGIFD